MDHMTVVNLARTEQCIMQKTALNYQQAQRQQIVGPYLLLSSRIILPARNQYAPLPILEGSHGAQREKTAWMK